MKTRTFVALALILSIATGGCATTSTTEQARPVTTLTNFTAMFRAADAAIEADDLPVATEELLCFDGMVRIACAQGRDACNDACRQRDFMRYLTRRWNDHSAARGSQLRLVGVSNALDRLCMQAIMADTPE